MPYKFNPFTGTFDYYESGSTIAIDAVDVAYDNLASGLSSTDVQGAIDELSVFISGVTETQNLEAVLILGNASGANDINFDIDQGLYFANGSRLREGTIDAGLGGSKGIAQICSVGYELKWEYGRLYVMDGNGLNIRQSLYNFAFTPTLTDDDTLGYAVGSLWTLDDGTVYVCSDATTGAAVWTLQSSIPTKTSDLINDGADGVSHFISLNDLPSNLVLYPTTAASDIPTYFKLVDSITDPSYDTIAANVSTGAITTTNQFISALVTSANVIIGNPGVFNISTIGNIRRTSGTGNAVFYFEVWKRNLAGTETFITTSGNTPPVFNGIYAEFLATALWNDGIFLATDRIVLKFYAARVAGGSDPTYDFQFGGLTPVRSLVPIPLTVIPAINLGELQDVIITSAAKGNYLEYDGTVWVNRSLFYTIELIDALTVDFYTPYDLKINSTTNIKNAPTITIQDDGAAYTLTNTIAVGSKITETATIAGVVNLNITKA
jgi:hypothetical protein